MTVWHPPISTRLIAAVVLRLAVFASVIGVIVERTVRLSASSVRRSWDSRAMPSTPRTAVMASARSSDAVSQFVRADL